MKVNRIMLVSGLGLLMLATVVSLACGSESPATPQGTNEEVGASPSAAQPKIHFDEDLVDLGMVPHGEVVDYIFDFRNMGDAPLIIEGVSAKALEGC